MLWFCLALLALAALYLSLIRPQWPRRPMPEGLAGHAYAHRGLWDAQRSENSLAAFANAHAHGFGVELDVRLTADGTLAVFHDDTLQRMCGDPRRIDDCPTALWRAIRLPDGSAIPTLAEALTACAGAPLVVELKTTHHPALLCEKALEQLRTYPGAWCMESFDPRIVRHLRRHAPQVFRGQLGYASGAERTLPQRLLALQLPNALGRPDFIAWQASDDHCFSMRLVRRLFRPHLAAWTVRSQREMDALRPRYDLLIFEGFVPQTTHDWPNTQL